MRLSLLEDLRAPVSRAPLEVLTLASDQTVGDPRIAEGVLYDAGSGAAFPIVNGVPIMLASAFPTEFLAAHAGALASLPAGLDIGSEGKRDWSFSREWEEHFEGDSERTWGWTVEERLDQALLELGVERSWFEGKRILEAGCGNGTFAEGLAGLGADVVGLDLSSSVHLAEAARKSANLEFMQGDLLTPPLREESFDAIISIGVLHHTPDTRAAFRRTCAMLAPGGLFYVWLYRRPEGFFKRYLKVPIYDAARLAVCRLPDAPQRATVHAHARLIRFVHRAFRKSGDIPLDEYVIAAYDDLTPRWRRYHTAYEVCGWFHECGFSAPRLTHWDNPYGFGLVARKAPQEHTPGVHFGAGAKLWDSSQTVVG